MIPPHICLLSETSHVSFDDLRVIAAGIDKALPDFCDAWDIERARCVAARELTKTNQRVSQIILRLVDRSSVEDGAGWHTEEDGTIFGEIAAGTLIRGGSHAFKHGGGKRPSISSIVAHEVFETLINPYVNLWVDRGDGLEDAREVCDAVQGTTFFVTLKHPRNTDVDLCNYLLPAWFNADAPEGSKFDKLGRCQKPFEVLPSGYHVIRRTSAEVAEDGAARAVHQIEGIGNASYALTKRRPRALHGLAKAFENG